MNLLPAHRSAFVVTLIVTLGVALSINPCRADVRVVMEASAETTQFAFERILPPAINDVAANATLKVLDGNADANSGAIEVLTNGQIPSSDDEPRANFFFSAGTDGGYLEVDLGKVINVEQFATYSWHSGTRAAQVYRLFGADGKKDGFSRELKKGTDPTTRGWSLIASVNSNERQPQARRQLTPGGQHAVAISDTSGALGKFRYLLLDISPTEKADAFGNTFFSEIDVLEVAGSELKRLEVPKQKLIEFTAENGKYEFAIDVTRAPDLAEWSESALQPVIEQWYPKIVDLLPSEGYVAPRKVRLRYMPDSQMKGIPAYASGAVVTLNTEWFRKELMREARGAVVHELVHVVQAYRGGERGRRNRTPGWVVEGVPDYVRWFLYEPESRGAQISSRNLAAARYDANYRISANFLNWVAAQYGEKVIVELNRAAREGAYEPSFWNDQTGKSEVQLNDEWIEHCKQQIEAAKAAR